MSTLKQQTCCVEHVLIWNRRKCVHDTVQNIWNSNVAIVVQLLYSFVLERHIFVLDVMKIFKGYCKFLIGRKNLHSNLPIWENPLFFRQMFAKSFIYSDIEDTKRAVACMSSWAAADQTELGALPVENKAPAKWRRVCVGLCNLSKLDDVLNNLLHKLIALLVDFSRFILFQLMNFVFADLGASHSCLTFAFLILFSICPFALEQ